ncbi:hypothetical protein [Pelomicrobium sp.]|jgi:hypothetical protein|uniref:hypothetical protein n=1 Tax=Pelomicrobium sp. TaxID=2815319 RepID=UPI002FDCC9B0
MNTFESAAEEAKQDVARALGSGPPQQPMTGAGMPEAASPGEGSPLTTTPGGSNLGNLLGGGQRTVVIQPAPEQAGQESQKDDLPPPR